MNIVRCPRCQDDVTVPLRASPKALVRCPLCLEEYTLAEALGGLPPALIVLDGSDAITEQALVGAGVAQVESGETWGGHPRDSKPRSGDEYQLSGGYGAALEAGGPSDAIAAPRPAVKGTRPKKKEKNGFVELLKIVLGGVVGLTVGYFVLLWGFSMDVLGLGPKVARYAPWIVPARFHGEPSASSTASTSGGALDTSGNSSPAGITSSSASANGNQKRQQGAMQPVGEGVAPSSAADIAVPGPTLAESDAEGGPGGIAVEPHLKPIPLPEPDVGPLLPEANPKATTPVETPEPDPLAPRPEPKPEPKPESSPEPSLLPTADELSKAVLAASEGTTKVNEATGQPAEVRRQLFIDLYGSASDAGRILSQLDAASPDFSEQVATLKTALASLAMQPGKLSALKALTDINLRERKHDEGVLLAGVVQEFAPAGKYHGGTFLAGKSGTEVVIASASELKEVFLPGDELLLVGRVVDDPAKNVPGYEGEAPRVVLLGCAVPVPKAE